jgi:hypothetical protein
MKSKTKTDQQMEVLEKRIAAVESQIQKLLELINVTPEINTNKIEFAQPIHIDEISD